MVPSGGFPRGCRALRRAWVVARWVVLLQDSRVLRLAWAAVLSGDLPPGCRARLAWVAVLSGDLPRGCRARLAWVVVRWGGLPRVFKVRPEWAEAFPKDFKAHPGWVGRWLARRRECRARLG